MYKAGASLASWGVSRWALSTMALWTLAIATLLVTVPSLAPRNDYHTAFYPAGRAVLVGSNPYADSLAHMKVGLSRYVLANGAAPLAPSSPYPYPPAVALMLAPLSVLPYSFASRIWYLVNICALAVIALLLGSRLGRRSKRLLAGGLVFATLVGFAPVRFTLQMGQVDILVLLFIVAALALVEPLAVNRHSSASVRQFTGGVLLGLACVVKLYPIAIVFYAALRRRYLLVFSALATACATLVLSAVILGPHVLGDYFAVARISSEPGYVAYPFSFGLFGFAYRALTINPYSVPLIMLPGWLIKPLFFLAALGVAAAVAALIGCRPGRLRWSELSIVCVSTLTIFPLLEIQHLSLLMAVLPGFAIFLSSSLVRNGVSTRLLRVLAVLAAFVPLGLAVTATTLPGKAVVSLTIVLALLLSAFLVYWLRQSSLSAIVKTSVVAGGIMYLALASPAFQNMAAWWGSPMSSLHVFVGEGQLYVLVLLGACLAILTRPSPQRTMGTSREIVTRARSEAAASPLLDQPDCSMPAVRC
jgi:hypothetical protein